MLGLCLRGAPCGSCADGLVAPWFLVSCLVWFLVSRFLYSLLWLLGLSGCSRCSLVVGLLRVGLDAYGGIPG